MIVSKKQKRLKKIISFAVLTTFVFLSVVPPPTVFAQTPVPVLPSPGSMLKPSAAYVPVLLKGLRVYPEKPLEFSFVIDKGDSGLEGESFVEEAQKLVKYFMASLTLPEKDIWVNLSPYEGDRMINDKVGETELGRDLLAQDYLLKQLTASLIYPEDDLGKSFWDKVYKQVYEKYGTTDIPVNTFNKVWIVAERAEVIQSKDAAYVADSHLKVMMEEDYLALAKNSSFSRSISPQNEGGGKKEGAATEVSAVSSKIVREIIVPAIEKEVNEGKHFADLRQIYNAHILATWYKRVLKESLLGKIYVDQNKVKGIEQPDVATNQRIYDQYLEAFSKGAFDLVREDYDESVKDYVHRRYFSGGLSMDTGAIMRTRVISESAQLSPEDLADLRVREGRPDLAQFDYKVVENKIENDIASLDYQAKYNIEEYLHRLPSPVQDSIRNKEITEPKHLDAIAMVVQAQQTHLYDEWETFSITERKAFLEQVLFLPDFVGTSLNGKKLLREYYEKADPYPGAQLGLPENVIDLRDISPDSLYWRYSQIASKHAVFTVFALPGGGQGHRLGFPWIKGGIEVSLIRQLGYYGEFIKVILAIERLSNMANNFTGNNYIRIPFNLMTSEDNHDMTVDYLIQNNFFGMNGFSVIDQDSERVEFRDGKLMIVDLQGNVLRELNQIVIFRQKSVPTMAGRLGRFFFKSKGVLSTSPHGHVDIVKLQKVTNLAAAYKEAGKKQTIFFQDTNLNAKYSFLPLIGTLHSERKDFVYSAYDRLPGEKTGVIAMLKNLAGKIKEAVLCIEYSHLPALLAKGTTREEDLKLGNINTFAISQRELVNILNETNGDLPLMVNPKSDETSREEGLMQELSRFNQASQTLVLQFSRLNFAATKNGKKETREALAKNAYPENLAAAESHFYRAQRALWASAGVKIDVEGKEISVYPWENIVIKNKQNRVLTGFPFYKGALVVGDPAFEFDAFVTSPWIVAGGEISDDSTLIIQNPENDNLVKGLHNLHLNKGTLTINPAAEHYIFVRNLTVSTPEDLWELVPISEEEEQTLGDIQVTQRGLKLVKNGPGLVIDTQGMAPGHYVLNAQGKLVPSADTSNATVVITNAQVLQGAIQNFMRQENNVHNVRPGLDETGEIKVYYNRVVEYGRLSPGVYSLEKFISDYSLPDIASLVTEMSYDGIKITMPFEVKSKIQTPLNQIPGYLLSAMVRYLLSQPKDITYKTISSMVESYFLNQVSRLPATYVPIDQIEPAPGSDKLDGWVSSVQDRVKNLMQSHGTTHFQFSFDQLGPKPTSAFTALRKAFGTNIHFAVKMTSELDPNKLKSSVDALIQAIQNSAVGEVLVLPGMYNSLLQDLKLNPRVILDLSGEKPDDQLTLAQDYMENGVMAINFQVPENSQFLKILSGLRSKHSKVHFLNNMTDIAALDGERSLNVTSAHAVDTPIAPQHGGIDLGQIQDKLIIKRGDDWEPLPVEMQDLPYIQKNLQGMTPIMIRYFMLPSALPFMGINVTEKEISVSRLN